jgi:hypothetical protein
MNDSKTAMIGVGEVAATDNDTATTDTLSHMQATAPTATTTTVVVSSR